MQTWDTEMSERSLHFWKSVPCSYFSLMGRYRGQDNLCIFKCFWKFPLGHWIPPPPPPSRMQLQLLKIRYTRPFFFRLRFDLCILAIKFCYLCFFNLDLLKPNRKRKLILGNNQINIPMHNPPLPFFLTVESINIDCEHLTPLKRSKEMKLGKQCIWL